MLRLSALVKPNETVIAGFWRGEEGGIGKKEREEEME